MRSLDLLTAAEVMPFILRRLLVSGSAAAAGARGPDMHSEVSSLEKNLRDVPGPVELTHSALLYNADRSLSLSPSPQLPPSSPSFVDSICFFST